VQALRVTAHSQPFGHLGSALIIDSAKAEIFISVKGVKSGRQVTLRRRFHSRRADEVIE
jgi:hypothetical protein